MLLQKARLGVLAIVMLVALRFTIGYHFYMEGADKVRAGNFSSKGFLTAAKGPFADQFKSLIPDLDGLARLPELRENLSDEGEKPEEEKKSESEKTFEPADKNPILSYIKLFGLLNDYRDSVVNTYGFSAEEQKQAAQEITNRAKSELVDFAGQWQAEIVEYLQGYQRVELNRADAAKSTVPGMRRQKEEIEGKWRAIAAPLLPQVDRILATFEADLNGLATEEQKAEAKKKYVKFKLPGEGPISVDLVDKYIPIFDMTVGILLMLGLLTPLAGTAAGLFLLSVVLTQFPGAYGAQPTYYQAIEMFACFVLVFTDAGRYAGLDFLPWSFWNRNKCGQES